MASNKLSAILKSRSTYSITLSVLVSFLFVFAFATSTTTLSSTGITATGSGSFATMDISATTTIMGSLGVGTTDPNYQMEVIGPLLGAAVRFSDNLNGSLIVRFPEFNLTDVFGDSQGLSFTNQGGEIMRLQGGNVGIGTTSPIGLLHLQGTTDVAQFLIQGINLAPADPTGVTGMKTWYKADALVLGDGDPVSSWVDSSGNGNDLAQAVTSWQPTYRTGVMNNQPVVRFDGINDSATTTFGIAQVQPYTMFVVSKFNSYYNNQEGILDGGADLEAYLFRSGGNNDVYFNDSGQIGPVTSTTNKKHVYAVVADTGSSNIRVDGGVPVIGSLNGTALAGLMLGGRFSGTEYGDVDIAEVIIYDGVLSENDIVGISEYLAGKYDVPYQRSDLQKWLSSNGTTLASLSSSGSFTTTGDIFADSYSIGGERFLYNGGSVDNTFLGAHSSFGNTTGTHNTFLGRNAGQSNTTGEQNTFVGSHAAAGITAGSENVVVAYDTNSGPYSNRMVAIGNGALNTANPQNDTITAFADYVPNTGNEIQITSSNPHPFVGGEFIQIIGTTNYNDEYTIVNIVDPNTFTVAGTFSVDDATGVWFRKDQVNIALGHQAGYNTTYGGGNSFIGYQSGYSNITGYNNFLGGYQAGYYGESSGLNTYVGYQAGYGSSTDPATSSGNVFMGYRSGYGVAGAAYENTAIGREALLGLTTGNSNIAMGYRAGAGITDGTRNVFLGYTAGASELGSNRLYVANSDPGNFTASSTALIYGEFDNRILSFNTAKIGINNVNPQTSIDFGTSVANLGQIFNIWTNGNERAGLGMDNDTAGLRLYVPENTGSNIVFGSIQTSDGSTFNELVTVDGYTGSLTLAAGLLNVASSTATSTFAGNLDVLGTIHGQNIYSGDLIFANAFRFYEDPKPVNGINQEGPQSLKLTNQLNEDILTIDDQGNLTIKGKLTQASSTQDSIISLGLSWILDQFKTIGVTIADGVISAKEFIAEKVTAKRVSTEEVCIEDVCINRNQLKDLLDKNGIGQISQTVIETTPEVVEPAPTTTEESIVAPIVVEPATEPIPADPVAPPIEESVIPTT